MREVKNCAECGEEFVTYWNAKFCRVPCYVSWRRKRGWFVNEEMVKHSRGSLSYSLRRKRAARKEVDKNVMEM